MSGPTRPLKRIRSTSPTFSLKWAEILKTWTKIVKKTTLHDEDGVKCSVFLSSGVLVTVRNIESVGLNSEIYSISLDGKLSPVILKKFIKTSELSPEIEAELQMWSAKYGLAPKVKAYNSTAMISEKCERPLEKNSRPDGYKYIRGLSAKRFQLNTYNQALGGGPLQIFNIIFQMHDKCGLYNVDPNMDNYMYLKNKLVQIDYGQNRFSSELWFRKWWKLLPPHLKKNKKELKCSLLEKGPVFPPTFHWYAVFIGFDQDVYKKWSRKDWSTFILQLNQKRQLLIGQIKQECEEIKNKHKLTFKQIHNLLF